MPYDYFSIKIENIFKANNIIKVVTYDRSKTFAVTKNFLRQSYKPLKYV